MGGFAWVTLATNDSYSLGALVLAHSLKQAGTSHQLAVLVTPGVTGPMREKLQSVFNIVQEVNILDSKDEANLRLLKRPELGVTFTKLHCWRLTQFDKCVFLDADTLVLKNCDELFDREELSAAPDVGWPDCFNSGVFVYRPSNETYEKLVKFALDKGSFDGGDQGLLNLYFSDWATKDISKHLPFIYNLCSTACYSYLPAFKQFGADAKIIHFIGASKPWLQYFNTETRRVQPTPDLKHLEGILQLWWNIFCSLIHPNLSPDMAPSTSDVTHTTISPCTSPEPHSTKNVVWDPWEEYDQKQSNLTLTPPEIQTSTLDHSHPPVLAETQPSFHFHQTYEPQIKPIESHNTNAHNASHHVQNLPPIQSHPEFHTENSHPQEEQPNFHSYDTHPYPIPAPVPLPSEFHSHIQLSPFEPLPVQDSSKNVPEPLENQFYSSQDPPPQTELFTHAPTLLEPTPSVHSNECEAAATVCTETTLHTPPCEDKDGGGLAGAFAQLTLGTPRTAEQSALDDHLRRQGWEVGNIDYMGRDSFDNIWSKICETLSAGLPAETSKTAETTPSSKSEEKPVDQTTAEASIKLPEELPPPAPTAPTAEISQDIPKESPKTETPVEVPAPAESISEAAQCPLTSKPKEESVATEAPLCPLPVKPATPETVPTSQEAAAVPTLTPEASVPPQPIQETLSVAEPSQETPVIPPTQESSGPQVTAAPVSETPQIPTTVESVISESSAAQPSSESPPAPQPAAEAPLAPQPPSTETKPEAAQSTVAASTPTPETPQSPPVVAVETTPDAPTSHPPPSGPESTPAPAEPQSVPAATVTPTPVPETSQPAPPAPESKPVPATPQPAPPAPESTPESKPVPATPQPAPPAPESTPESKPVPATPQPAPPAPESTPEFKPVPATPQPAPPAPKSKPVPVRSQPAPSAPETTPASETPQPAPTAPESAPAPAPESTPTPATPQSPQPAPEPKSASVPATPQSPPAAPPAPEPTPAVPQPTQATEPQPAKSGKESKAAEQPKPAEATAAAPAAQPTPPPRKTAGGGKKKSKK